MHFRVGRSMRESQGQPPREAANMVVCTKLCCDRQSRLVAARRTLCMSLLYWSKALLWPWLATALSAPWQPAKHKVAPHAYEQSELRAQGPKDARLHQTFTTAVSTPLPGNPRNTRLPAPHAHNRCDSTPLPVNPRNARLPAPHAHNHCDPIAKQPAKRKVALCAHLRRLLAVAAPLLRRHHDSKLQRAEFDA